MFILAVGNSMDYIALPRAYSMQSTISNDNTTGVTKTTIEDQNGKVLYTSSGASRLLAPDLTLDTGEHRLTAKVYGNTDTPLRVSNTVHVSVPFSGEYGPRFGIHDKVMSLTDYDDAFFRSLTLATLTETGDQLITCPPDESTSDNKRFFYVAWPKRLMYGFFQETAQGFTGSWDGAMEFDDFNFEGAAEVSLGGYDYVVYRNDFPFDSLDYVFRIKYGSTSNKSGDPV
ncbi:hypothetical protein MPK74_gp165 [Erwinia phage pEa_SNUABM_7]|uniref:Uncharacterized protein n=1 Tax=Erwinia phage pEa_SNUABM_7 TaxID=2866695 RepID=A0AAE7WSB5_9CAUD|nr:hypothetical protein MPK74_gp165 [Erwinia phage pEa_SNUABM_7]QYW04833.1 hypothetical protein pEaSNUABM7_00165 [Erwinia phage pEa_SNUABM_7]